MTKRDIVEENEGIYERKVNTSDWPYLFENAKKELTAFKPTPKVDLRCKRCSNCSHRVAKNCELGIVLGIELIREVWCSKWEYDGN